MKVKNPQMYNELLEQYYLKLETDGVEYLEYDSENVDGSIYTFTTIKPEYADPTVREMGLELGMKDWVIEWAEDMIYDVEYSQEFINDFLLDKMALAADWS